MAEELDVFGNKKPETAAARKVRIEHQRYKEAQRKKSIPMSKRGKVVPAVAEAVVGGAERLGTAARKMVNAPVGLAKAVGRAGVAVGEEIGKATTPLSQKAGAKAVEKRRSIKALEASEKSGAAEDARIDKQLASQRGWEDRPIRSPLQAGAGTPEEVAARKGRDEQAIAEDAAERKRVEETGTRHKPGTVGHQRWQEKQRDLAHLRETGEYRAPFAGKTLKSAGVTETAPGKFESAPRSGPSRKQQIAAKRKARAEGPSFQADVNPYKGGKQTAAKETAAKKLDIAGIRRGLGEAYGTAKKRLGEVTGAVGEAGARGAKVLKRTGAASAAEKAMAAATARGRAAVSTGETEGKNRWGQKILSTKEKANEAKLQARAKAANERDDAAKARRAKIRKKRLGMSRRELLQAPGASRTQVQRGRQLTERVRRAAAKGAARRRRLAAKRAKRAGVVTGGDEKAGTREQLQAKPTEKLTHF